MQTTGQESKFSPYSRRDIVLNLNIQGVSLQLKTSDSQFSLFWKLQFAALFLELPLLFFFLGKLVESVLPLSERLPCNSYVQTFRNRYLRHKFSHFYGKERKSEVVKTLSETLQIIDLCSVWGSTEFATVVVSFTVLVVSRIRVGSMFVSVWWFNGSEPWGPEVQSQFLLGESRMFRRDPLSHDTNTHLKLSRVCGTVERDYLFISNNIL